MTTVQAIKQLEERSVASEITLMVWNDRMDLVALANVKGEVALHRLTWTKAWSLRPPKDGLKVKGIAWRPDGRIIAIAYSSGQVILVKVENNNVLHVIETMSDICCVNWVQGKVLCRDKTSPTVDEDSEQQSYMKYIDLSANFLAEPTSQQFDTSTPDEVQKPNLLQDQTHLNLLLIGTTDGIVHSRIFGCFPCALMELSAYLSGPYFIKTVHFIEDLSRMFIVVKDSTDEVKILLLNSEILKTHTNELFAIALKNIKLTSLLEHISNTITTITESWESILLEMDNKLSKYASKVPVGGVTADFLELLTFGICSDEMKAFLLQDLTKKGLEKFGQTIEMSYANIQKLVLKYIMKFGQNITYHLAEMRGMARLEHRYKILGLSESALTDAILANGAFLIKGGEMQQIINHSITNYKAFFRWLYTAIMHVMEEQTPNEIPKMTQQDLAYIAEFLQNFDHIGNSSQQSGFKMERLGQYLSDTPLSIKPNMAANEWTCFLAENLCVQEHSNILKHFEDMSLIQQYKHLKAAIDVVFTTPNESISRQFELIHIFDCFNLGKEFLQTSQMNVNEESSVFTFLQPPENVYALHIEVADKGCIVKGCSLHFSQYPPSEQGGNFIVADAKLYSNTVLSLLLQENATTKGTVLYQMPLAVALEKFSEVADLYAPIFSSVASVDGFAVSPKLFKNVEGMVGSQFATSGSRKVGIVLSENRRKVRLYEMEAEEEEDEDADMTSSQRE